MVCRCSRVVTKNRNIVAPISLGGQADIWPHPGYFGGAVFNFGQNILVSARGFISLG